MTAANRRPRARRPSLPAGGPSKPAARKAVLFCPVCDRDAPVDGDWTVLESDDDREELACPQCGHVLVSQPRYPEPGDRAGSLPGVGPILQIVDAVVGHHVR